MNNSIRNLSNQIPYLRGVLRRLTPTTDIYRAKVASEAHNGVVTCHNGTPIPPIRLRDMVRRGAILSEDFILEGQQAHRVIHRVASETGEPIDSSTRLLEFGVGCGRVARHFLSEGMVDFTGVDVDEELIAWCMHNLSITGTVKFLKNAYQPPIPCDADRFDLAYSISVFTHMDADSQRAWAIEMGRVVRHGGRLLVSFLERSSEELPAGIAVRDRIDPEYSRTWFGEDGAPLNYYSTFNTKQYLSELFSEAFDLIGYRERIVRDHQSMLILRKR